MTAKLKQDASKIPCANANDFSYTRSLDPLRLMLQNINIKDTDSRQQRFYVCCQGPQGRSQEETEAEEEPREPREAKKRNEDTRLSR